MLSNAEPDQQREALSQAAGSMASLSPTLSTNEQFQAYMKAGQKDLAIVNYKKSLQLDPGNQNAVGLLKKLQAPD